MEDFVLKSSFIHTRKDQINLGHVLFEDFQEKETLSNKVCS